jgi:TolB-like protein/Flp pilus assembly protein TadD
MGSPEDSVPHQDPPREAQIPTALAHPVTPHPLPPDPFWSRIKRHKVVEWTLAYVAFGYALLHGVQMLRESFEWPLLVSRLTAVALVLGAPIAVTLAWYHGHRARHRVSGQELSILIALLVVAGSVLWWASRSGSFHAASTVATDSSHHAEPLGEKSIAVLPFVDLSERHDQEYFADGMAEEILDILAKVPQLTVIGRTSSFQFKNRTEDLRAIGEKLNSAYVVEGSVRKAGERIRVTAQLIDAQSGAHLWSDTYNRNYGDALALQDEISAAIARALQLTVAAREVRPLRNTQATEAYTLYLKGNLAIDKFEAGSMLEAQNYFQQALTLDPTLLPAAEGLAQTYVARGLNEEDISGRDAWEKAREAARKALQMDDRSASAHSVLGLIAGWLDYDWATAESEFRRALALKPNAPETLFDVAEISAMHGDYDGAVQRVNASLALDPLNANTYELLGAILYMKGDFPSAESALRKSLTINPEIDVAHYMIGLMKVVQGRPEEALKEFAADPEVSVRDTGLALVNHALGKKAESDAALSRVVNEVGKYWPYGIALIHAYRGERDSAFDWLEKAHTDRDVDLVFVLSEPFLVPLHDDPRWSALMKSMNLAESVGRAPQSPAQ